MIQDISNRLMKEFADCLQQRIEAPPAAEPTIVDAVMAATPEGAAMAPPAAGGSQSGTTTKPIGGFSLFFRALARPAAPGLPPRLSPASLAASAGSSRRNAGSIVCGIGDSR